MTDEVKKDTGSVLSSRVGEDIQIPPGFAFLVNGYAEYAAEVVTERAIVGIDGFKPVNRRILYAMLKGKVKEMKKSATVVGYVLEYHPHGDRSIYDTMVRMVDSSEYMSIPFIKGKGSWGKVYSTDTPSAMRYTNVMLHPNSEMVFDGMDGIKMVPTEDGEALEPELLPTAFPNVLCNPDMGIAVGVASNIPAFNFHEVIKSTIELIETGDIKGLLAPDFTTKGYYVWNEKELRKMMETGRGSYKLRGKWHVDGKKIVITEIPYYTTIQSIIDQINEKEIEGVQDVRNLQDRTGMGLVVECRNKRVVDQVLTSLLRDTDLQMTRMANITVIVNNRPRLMGIKQLLSEWVKFREGVVRTNLQKQYDGVLAEIARYEILVDLLSNVEKRDEFVNLLTQKSSGHARKYLHELYPGTDDDTFTWILRMSLSSLSGVASKENKLVSLRMTKAQLEQDLANVRGVIVRELKELDSKYSFPRNTEVTEEDYNFEAKKDIIVKAEPVPVFVEVDGKFIKKMHMNPFLQNEEGIKCMSDDVISFIDNKGRLIRVDLENLPFMSETERGVYLPVYLETEDDFDLIAYDLIEDKKVGYVYSDGFASVVDYSEWVNAKRTTRITNNGVSPLSSLIVGEFDFTKEYLLIMTEKNLFGFVTTDFKEKHRTARTKIINVKKDDKIVTVVPVTYSEMLKLVTNPEKYRGKLSLLDHGDTFDVEFLSTLM